MMKRAMPYSSLHSGGWLLVAAISASGVFACANSSGLPQATKCQLFWRAGNTLEPGDSPGDPKFEFQERVLRVEQEQEASERLADIVLTVTYSVSKFEGSSINVRAAFDDKPLVSWLYQLPDEPQNSFAHGHGFTGLVYLTHPTKGGDYQLMCEFVN